MGKMEGLKELAQDVMSASVKAKFMKVEEIGWTLLRVFDLIVEEVQRMEREMAEAVEEMEEEVVEEM